MKPSAFGNAQTMLWSPHVPAATLGIPEHTNAGVVPWIDTCPAFTG